MTGDSSKPLVSSIDKVQTNSSPNSHKYITPELIVQCKRVDGWLVGSTTPFYGSTQGSNLDSSSKIINAPHKKWSDQRILAAKKQSSSVVGATVKR